MSQGVAEFRTPEEAAAKSPLAAKLFGIDGVKGVFYGADFISITKDDSVDWADIKTYILGVMFEQFSMDKPLMIGAEDDAVSGGEDSDVVKQIKSILDERVRPAVARDGGDIVFHSFEKGIVFLKMRGACSGCPSSTMTLKVGIENMLRHYLPEILEVRAMED